MAIFKCKMCGGDLNVTEEIKIIECDYCGTSQTVAAADSEKKITLFNRANRLRMMNDFDKAAGIYESIIAEFPEEAEAYWGLCLCKYGIEYVDDPATAKKIPTCHRSSFESIMDDSDFEQVMEYADALTRKVYRDEAKQIEEIRKGIIAVSANEEPYDIFICYKETAENGDRTLDSVIAQDVYDELTGKGYRVFFSRITLEDKLGVEYEPYIFAALNSAKIMLVFGTTPDHIEAVWVRNEWSRFLKLMAKDRSKVLIPCFKDMDAYELPTQFRALQAQDMGKVGATQDLMRGIEKILPKNNNTPVATSYAVNSNAMVMRGQFALEDKDFKKANEYFERALDQNPQEGSAYLGKVLASLGLTNPEEINNLIINLDSFKDFDRAIKFSDPGTSALLREIKNKSDKKLHIKRLTGAIKSYITKKKEEEARVKAEEERRLRVEEQARIKAEQEYIKLEQARIKSEQESAKAKKLYAKFCEMKKYEGFISAGNFDHTVSLNSNGTVVATGEKKEGKCDVKGWYNIVAVSAGGHHTVGLRADGTAVAVGAKKLGGYITSDWVGLVAVSAGANHTVGLRADGTVVATELKSGNLYINNGQCNVSGWTNIVAVSAGSNHTVGLKSDGTVVAVGLNDCGQCDVSGWKDIVAVSAGGIHTVGLKADGTVVAVGCKDDGGCNVSGWRDIVAVFAGEAHTVGLKLDGTVVAVGFNNKGQCNVTAWRDIIAISAGYWHTVGLRADGAVVAVGDNNYGQCNVGGWCVFASAKTANREFESRMQPIDTDKQQRRLAGVCQHCGSEFKGLFTKKCVRCGKPKDY